MSSKHALSIARPRISAASGLTAPPEPKRTDAELLTPQHARWRRAVCDRAGWRCEAIDKGKRCTRSRANGDRMIADHVVERKDGGASLDPRNGQCMCVPHNTAKGARARAARMAERFG